jgi:hypothetical protein
MAFTDKQKEDIRRVAHIFQNNPDIVKDYYQQIKDESPDPQLNVERLTDLWKSDVDKDREDWTRYNIWTRAGDARYDIKHRGKALSETDLGTMSGMTLGVGSGLLKIGQGIGEVGGIGIDISSDWLSDKIGTDIRTDTLGFIEENYPELEIDTFAGKSAELITQYGTGYGIVKKLLEKGIKKRGKAYLKSREYARKNYPTISKIAEYGAPAALSEPFVSTSRDVTLLQAFGLYDKPITRGDDISPAEKATNLLKQKLLFGAEGIPTVGGISVGLPVLARYVGKKGIQAGGVVSRTAGRVIDPVARAITGKYSPLPPALRQIRKGFEKVSDSPLLRKIPPVSDWRLYSIKNRGNLGEQILGGLNFVLSSLRTNAQLTPDAMDMVRLSEDTVRTVRRSVSDNLEILSNKVHTLADEMVIAGQKGSVASAWSQKVLQDDLLNFITNPKMSSDILPKGTRLAAKRIRNLLQGIKKEYRKVVDESGEAIDGAFRKDLDEYLTMSFKILKEGPGSVSTKTIKEVAKLYATRLKEIPEWKFKNPKAIQDIAEKRVTELISKAEKDNISTAQLIREAGEALEKDIGFLKPGETIPDIVKKLYGQVDDVRDRILDTVIELGSTVAKKRMYDGLAKSGQGQWLFRDADELVVTKGIKTTLEPINIGPKADVDVAGKLNGLYTTPAIKKAIEQGGLLTDKLVDLPFYRSFLQLKGATQISKTILSPVTQIRNVTSAAGFALANGHFGRGASLLESIKFITRDLFIKDGKFDVEALQKVMAEVTEEGVVNSNLIQREIQLLAEDIAKGAGRSRITTTDQLFNLIYKSKPMQFLTKVYQSGDDIWKFYGYQFEKSRMAPLMKSLDDVVRYHKEVLGKNFDVDGFLARVGKKSTDAVTPADLEIAIRKVASNVVKNTYPNYNYVPTLIQNLRRLPVGNFVSFPAEMMRTSANLLRYSINEMSSSNPEIRAIGAKRLIGFGTALLGVDRGLREIGQALTGVTNEELEALQRSYVASWNKQGPLMPISREVNEDGEVVIRYINTGYQNPYTSAIQGPFYVAMNAINDRQLRGQRLDEAMFKGIMEGFGALIEPFASEAIFYSALNDVTLRNGKTEMGRDIYFEEDPLGDKIAKSIHHLMWDGSLKPGVTDQLNKFARATANQFTDEGKDKFYSPQMKEYDITDEAAALFGGIRIYEVNVNDSFRRYEASKFSKRITSSRKQFADGDDGIYNGNNSKQDIVDYYYDYQLRNYRIFSDFHREFKDAVLLGIDPKELGRLLLKRGGIIKSDIRAIMTGTFNAPQLPAVGPRSRFAEIAKEKNMSVKDLVPWQELKEMRKKFLRVPLGLTPGKVKDFIFGRLFERFQEKRQQQSAAQPVIPITQPQTIAATPQVATSAVPGTDQGLSPTEIALLSPEEQLIKLRQNRNVV